MKVSQMATVQKLGSSWLMSGGRSPIPSIRLSPPDMSAMQMTGWAAVYVVGTTLRARARCVTMLKGKGRTH